MSRAGARARGQQQDAERKAARAARRVDAAFAQADAHAALDAVLVACDGCGLVQVAPASSSAIDETLDPAGSSCVLCGCWTGSFVETLPGNPVGSTDDRPTR